MSTSKTCWNANFSECFVFFRSNTWASSKLISWSWRIQESLTLRVIFIINFQVIKKHREIRLSIYNVCGIRTIKKELEKQSKMSFMLPQNRLIRRQGNSSWIHVCENEKSEILRDLIVLRTVTMTKNHVLITFWILNKAKLLILKKLISRKSNSSWRKKEELCPFPDRHLCWDVKWRRRFASKLGHGRSPGRQSKLFSRDAAWVKELKMSRSCTRCDKC